MRVRRVNIIKALAMLTALCLLVGSSAAAGNTIYGYSDGLALTTDGTLWGYVNTSGQEVVSIQYNSAQNFLLGVALVEKNGKLGLIRPDGKHLIAPEYDSLTGIGYGLYLAQKGNLWGVVSMVAFPSESGGETQELYPISYDSITQEQNSGLSVLTFRQGGVPTVVPMTTLPGLLVERKVPSAQFPLIKGRAASFKDVGPRDWYAPWVSLAYNVGLMEGKGGGAFDPMGTLTVAEVLKLAANMESRFTDDNFHTQPVTGTPWYRQAVVYCIASGIVKEGEFDNFDRPVTRAEMAKIFAATSLGRSVPIVNDLSRVKLSLPDVKAGSYAADAIFGLYGKGVFTGTDGAMTFRPDGKLTRAEAAAVVSRMARTEQRITLW